MSNPANFSTTFEVDNETTPEKLEQIYDICLDLADLHSQKVLKGEESEYETVMAFLECAQKVIISQAARHKAEGHWWKQMRTYSGKLISICDKFSKQIKGTEITNTVLDRLLPNLVISLCLFQYDLEFIATTIQPVMGLVSQLNQLPNFGTEQKVSKVTEIVESPHPYNNSARETHWVRIPGAKKFKLIFDPECKTENQYDYLELWLDEEK